MAESSQNANAHALTSREDSRGLWQINVRAHPEYRNANLYDPAVNAQAARAVLRKQGWGAWSVYSRVKAGLYGPAAAGAVSGLGTRTAAEDAVGAAAGAAGSLADATGVGAAKNAIELAVKAGEWMTTPANWVRIIYVSLGGALVIGALWLVAWPMVKPAAQTAAKAASKGVV
jgi:hypothetical protein